MRRRRRTKRRPIQLAILLTLLFALAVLLGLEAWRAAARQALPTPEPAAVTPEPSPSPSAAPTPVPTPAPTPPPMPAPTPDARYHSGDPELDELLYAVVEEQTDEEMTDEEKLNALYNYVAGSFGYLRRSYYEPGETGWENAEAMTMLTTGKGNCYNFAATFCLLARCIGYDAVACSGTVYGQAEEGQSRPPDRPHGWVEITIDGETWIFDPDMQATVAYWEHDDSFFKRGGDIRGQYGYRCEKAEDVTENP